MSRCCLLIATVTLVMGCTHTQLRLDTVHQAEALNQVEQQQVLDNLAMFVVNPNAVPYFTEVTGGFSEVSDTTTGTATPLWVKAGFSQISATFTGSRLNQEQFSTLPVTDPFRLTWMRCVYRAAVGAPLDPVECSEVCSIIATWNKSLLCSCTDHQAPEACLASCLPTCGWFHVCPKRKVPRCAKYVGHYCDTCIWVSDDGTEEFGRLTTIILGLAAAKRQTQWMSTKNSSCPTPDGTMTPMGRTLVPMVNPMQAPTCVIMETTTIGDAGTTSQQKSANTQGAVQALLAQ
jgi:hypothetical protein